MNAIAYRRGRVHMETREALTSAVCECYNNMQLTLDPLRRQLFNFLAIHNQSQSKVGHASACIRIRSGLA